MSRTPAVQALRELLFGVPAGACETEYFPDGSKCTKHRIEEALCAAWDDLRDLPFEDGTPGDKLPGRTEGMVWAAPLLTFCLERHPGYDATADLQHWRVDVDKGEASLLETTRRARQRFCPSSLVCAQCGGPTTAAGFDHLGRTQVRCDLCGLLFRRGPTTAVGETLIRVEEDPK